ncbi:CoA transferase [Caballeronia sp. LZ033]|uniref:CaiB/BaiF CoA-transferase family protein n=1 Tax=Caballeronia sp. LZ033 TaxID=3038566 RepID=UPI0028650B28|nr:CoA transferase [Caballeronia sp. LZ033]MDR5816272.1 CoA transferase [Caballeronia sp. LZ033]
MLDGVRVLACGARDAVRLCAVLLEQAGACVGFDGADATGYDVIVVSSDSGETGGIAGWKAGGTHIVCDITATGPQDSRAGTAWTDAQIQAMSGLMDTTGFTQGAPVRIGIPLTEISAALYAAAAIAAAVRVKRLGGGVQNIDVTLSGCAANALTTFLPAVFARRMAGRVGNRHPASAPWNAYRTRDGWILICTSTDEQWRKLKLAADMPPLDDARFATLAGRVRHVDELDALLESWTMTLGTEECVRVCERIGVAAGPIVGMHELAAEPNFRLRHAAAAHAIDTAGVGAQTYRQVPIFTESPLSEVHGVARPDLHASGNPAPLAGVKVIEIGQYTTAPLVGKHLAALGAEVVKIEPPDGEAARAWAPGQGGTSYFFALNNTDKQTLALDLKQEADRAHLRELLADADVLVENLRPGALAKLGFTRETLGAINPTLIYCSISGFGMASAYPSRPAFDTVIQAMSGLMDLTRSDGIPVKIGASGADILGGQTALFAILARLAGRARRASGTGAFIEISMQDVAAWCALFAAGRSPVRGEVLACLDGHVWIERETSDAERERCAGLPKARAAQQMASAVPVVRVDELLHDGNFLADVLSAARDEHGGFWPVLKPPYRLAKTPACVRGIPGAPRRVSEFSPVPPAPARVPVPEDRPA